MKPEAGFPKLYLHKGTGNYTAARHLLHIRLAEPAAYSANALDAAIASRAMVRLNQSTQNITYNLFLTCISFPNHELLKSID